LLIITTVLVLFLGIYLLCKQDSLKVIIPICCLILGLTICAVVTSCKSKHEEKQQTNNDTTVIIKDVKSESDIPQNEKSEIIKAYIIMSKENSL
jgi:multisubunit Na+/H+ antiporter MnhC subunit